MSPTSKGLCVSFTDSDGVPRQLLVDAQLPRTEKSALIQLLMAKGVDVPLAVEVPELRQLAQQRGLTEISWT
ncbi:hypothetical protein Q3O97_05450 [Ralstonia pseudosolanacearum]|uniref:hypothetical protein n=1 Tax=Ralstonia pseudosolanacearum TaxID=1310165 RepID=UPI0027055753|nr:hypothetical protein [Ralstonia pseudosolanacearum]MDO3615285.1 hypothetical protein [Ralstonia pseudosolanacearum]